MSILLSILAFLVIFSLLVLVHEVGHFVAAKRAGIKVLEFGFGLPPRLWGKKKGDTIYSINWIPFGGFVKMYGDDPNDLNLMKDSKSFIGKSLRKRIKVVLAGVFMNFVFAWFLLTIGFGFGMQPLIVTVSDAVSAINEGVIDLAYGISVKSVLKGSVAEKAGLKSGEVVVLLNGNPITNYDGFVSSFEKGSTDDFSVDIKDAGGKKNIKFDRESDEACGVTFDRLIFLTHPVVKSVKSGSLSDKAGISGGDIILSINGNFVYSVSDYINAIQENSKLDYKILRNFNEIDISVDLSKSKFVQITDVSSKSPAYLAGFRAGDIITKVSSAPVLSVQQVLNAGADNAGREISYTIFRSNAETNISVTPNASGKIGVGLTNVFYSGNYDLDLYVAAMPASILSIEDVHYPFYEAPYHALTESWRLTKFTAVTFIGVLESLIQKLTVPEGVAGPVGIARLTYAFVQEGIMALIRFTALLSLSLAVVNILPFPALDGGRFLFFFVEFVRGRRLNPKWESRIHAIGFMLLMLLIAVITWSDIVGLFE